MLSGKRILFIEADLRTASLDALKKKTDVLRKVGTLSEIISGHLTGEHLAKHVMEASANSEMSPMTTFGGGAMDFISPGEMSAADSVHFAGKKLSDFVASIRDSYDYIFIDGPSLSPWADVSFLKWVVDSVIVIVKSDRFAPWKIKDLLHRNGLESSKVCGAFLTGVDPLLGG